MRRLALLTVVCALGAATQALAQRDDHGRFAQSPGSAAPAPTAPASRLDGAARPPAPAGTAPAAAPTPIASAPILPRLVIVPRDRGAIQDWYRSQSKKGACPPGLARRNDTCEPPSHANASMAHGAAGPPIGAAVPQNVAIVPLPRPLLDRITTAPWGYAYGVADGHVVLYSVGTRVVADSMPPM